MAEFAQFAALGVSIVSFCLSLTAVLIHYAKRGENPVIAPLQTQVDALRLSQSDVIDRVDQFMRRDRTRRLRADKADEAPEALPEVPAKQQLRELARQRGLVR